MSDFGSIISELLSRFPSLFKIFLKKIYKLEVVKNRTIVDLASNESAVKLQLSDNGEVQIMVRIANYTPFDLKAQNMTFDIVWYGLNKKLRQTNYEIISKHSERTIFIREELSRDNIDKIIKALKQKQKIDYLSYKIDFENSLHSFQKTGSFNHMPLEVVNLEHVLKAKTDE